MSAKAEDLLRQQYLVPRKSVKKLREMSRREGVSAGELARRAIETYTSGKVLTESEQEAAAEEAAARGLLEDIHGQVRATLKRIDASLIEVRVRERALADGTFRAQVRKETQAWFEAHPHQAMIKAAAPDAAARIQLSYKRTMFIFASRFTTKHASSHWGALTAKQGVSYKVASS